MVRSRNGGAGLADFDAAHIALHDPADAIRRYEYALKVLNRHAVHVFDGHDAEAFGTAPWCGNCRTNQWPCRDLLNLAESLGIDTGGQP